MLWDVKFSKNAEKQAKGLNHRVLIVLQVLVESLKSNGGFPGKQWPNYGKLKGSSGKDKRHCHLIKGNPTYVCCWRVDKSNHLIEVYYVGTHEKAPY